MEHEIINLYGVEKNAVLLRSDIQGKSYSRDALGVELIRNLKAAAGRSTHLSSARKWTPRRVVNFTSPSSCHSRTAAGRSTPLSSARKWTPRRSVNVTSPYSCHSKTKIASTSSKSVFLHDWWLIKEDGKGLAIGGFTRLNERKSLFRSAVIIKRHDAMTVETKDAMTISIGGNINRQYSLGNGFSTEILNKFMIGFPCDWEEYAASQSTKPTDKPSSCPGSNNLLTSFNQIPAGKIRDFMSSLSMKETELLMKNMYEDLQKQLGKTPEGASVGSKNHRTTKATSNVEVDDEIQSKGKLQEGNQVEELKREASSIATKAEMEKEQKTDQNLNAAAAADAHVLVPKRRVFTRSMKNTLRSDLHDNIFQFLP